LTHLPDNNPRALLDYWPHRDLGVAGVPDDGADVDAEVDDTGDDGGVGVGVGVHVEHDPTSSLDAIHEGEHAMLYHLRDAQQQQKAVAEEVPCLVHVASW